MGRCIIGQHFPVGDNDLECQRGPNSLLGDCNQGIQSTHEVASSLFNDGGTTKLTCELCC